MASSTAQENGVPSQTPANAEDVVATLPRAIIKVSASVRRIYGFPFMTVVRWIRGDYSGKCHTEDLPIRKKRVAFAIGGPTHPENPVNSVPPKTLERGSTAPLLMAPLLTFLALFCP